ncbi:hypothetical protein [Deinococcus radiotolerans]|uniref:Transcriptional regulator n=1 Tax=Deinococcus radiotolerans TaxID=1309407 RepID=A0ABQ2FGQ5_9DEIO|nr:hypothetical protein [Deinococcus radiotolerans]GGK91509.1 hypothetical protein GCM10010844_07490 [Deinococcus radiotolerans]
MSNHIIVRPDPVTFTGEWGSSITVCPLPDGGAEVLMSANRQTMLEVLAPHQLANLRDMLTELCGPSSRPEHP